MAYKMFAAIYVGSSELAMKIFQVSAKKKPVAVDSVRRFIELGKDTYKTGRISPDAVNQVCEVLEGFKMKMKEYKVNEYRAYATSAVREAKNAEIVVDAIKRSTDIDVEILSNSAQRYINFKGLVANYDNFQNVVSKNTAFVDVGAGSVQVSLFDKKNLVVTENIHIGAVRIRDYLSILGKKTGRLDKFLAEYVGNDIATFRNIYLNDKEMKSLIAVGEVVNAFKKMVPGLDVTEKIDRAGFDALYKRIVSMTAEEISEKYGIEYERATLMLPNIIIYQSFLDNCKAEEIYVPNVDFCESIVASYMHEGKSEAFDHNFDNDIVAAATALAKRYHSNMAHVEIVSKFALKIFDSFKKIHGLTNRDRLLLQCACLLHECGNFINLNGGAENSYFIIANTEIIGLTHTERMEVASIVKYNVSKIPAKRDIMGELGECDYVKITKLAAIVRLANVLDKSHTQKMEDITITVKNRELIISAKTYEDISLEEGLFTERASNFEGVFGIKPLFRLKRSV